MKLGYKFNEKQQLQRDFLHAFRRVLSFQFDDIQDAHLCGVCRLLIAQPDKIVSYLQNAGYPISPEADLQQWVKTNVGETAQALIARLIEPEDMFYYIRQFSPIH